MKVHGVILNKARGSNESSQSIEKCVKILREYGASEIFLFGSRANGTFHDESDYDFAVRGLNDQHLFQLISKMESAIGRSVDLILLDVKNDFSKHIETKIEKGWAVNVG